MRLGVFGHAGHELRPLVEAFRTRHPECAVECGETNGNDAFTALRAGVHDAHALWLPVVEPDLTVGPTGLTGGRVLAVSADHPLAARVRRPWRTSPATMSSTGAPTPPSTGSPPWSPPAPRSATASPASPPRGPSTRSSPWSPRDAASTRWARWPRPLQQAPRRRLPAAAGRPRPRTGAHLAYHRRQPHGPRTGPDGRRTRPPRTVTGAKEDGHRATCAAPTDAHPASSWAFLTQHE
ncbi:LysR substrate-binding domain-containing protein [Streptomyces sp. NPDC057438]|uniref:LysR substrate-binding domain-containing protein n=1 Tax=Streptomyces sp. NPDC057438 TaxID=3346133 RepID=UPI00369679E9